LILFGMLKGDVEAPRKAAINREPCDECKRYMGMGVILISAKDDYRNWGCLKCKHSWESPVTLSEHTPNLSGEETMLCPQCQSRECSGGPIVKADTDNPYRTGGWCVVRDDFISRVIDSPLRETILEQRFCFVGDAAWDRMGLPRGPIPEAPSTLPETPDDTPTGDT
jgi:hypothetical protein